MSSDPTQVFPAAQSQTNSQQNTSQPADEQKDPMVELSEEYLDFAKNLNKMFSPSSDSAQDPMSMLQDSGAESDLDDFDAIASANNNSMSAGQGMDLEEVATLAI